MFSLDVGERCLQFVSAQKVAKMSKTKFFRASLQTGKSMSGGGGSISRILKEFILRDGNSDKLRIFVKQLQEITDVRGFR